MRWHSIKKCWYGYAKESDLINAIQSAEQQDGGEGATVYTDGYLGGGACYGSKSNKSLYGSDLAAAIRADIKAAGILAADAAPTVQIVQRPQAEIQQLVGKTDILRHRLSVHCKALYSFRLTRQSFCTPFSMTDSAIFSTIFISS